MSSTDVNDRYNDEESECQFCMKNSKCSNKLFHAMDILIGVLIICDALVLFAQIDSFVAFLLPVYFAIFGCLIISFAIYVPKTMNAFAPFYFTFIGRGIAYLLLGSVLLVFEHDYSIATGALTIITAFVYFSFSIYSKWCVDGMILPEPLVQLNETDDDKPASIQDANKRQQTSEPSSSTDEIRNKDFKERNYKINEQISKALTIQMSSRSHGVPVKDEGDVVDVDIDGDAQQYGVAVNEDDEQNLHHL